MKYPHEKKHRTSQHWAGKSNFVAPDTVPHGIASGNRRDAVASHTARHCATESEPATSYMKPHGTAPGSQFRTRGSPRDTARHNAALHRASRFDPAATCMTSHGTAPSSRLRPRGRTAPHHATLHRQDRGTADGALTAVAWR